MCWGRTFRGLPGAPAFRRVLSEEAHRDEAGWEVIDSALARVASPASGRRLGEPRRSLRAPSRCGTGRVKEHCHEVRSGSGAGRRGCRAVRPRRYRRLPRAGPGCVRTAAQAAPLRPARSARHRHAATAACLYCRQARLTCTPGSLPGASATSRPRPRPGRVAGARWPVRRCCWSMASPLLVSDRARARRRAGTLRALIPPERRACWCTIPPSFCAWPRRAPAAARPGGARGAFPVTPWAWAPAAESAQDNRYGHGPAHRPGRALAEHAALAAPLARRLPVVCFPGDAATPDAVFPNQRLRHCAGTRHRWPHATCRAPTRGCGPTSAASSATCWGLADRSLRRRFRGRADRQPGHRPRPQHRLLRPVRALRRDRARAMHAAFGLALTFCFRWRRVSTTPTCRMSVLAGRAPVIARDGFAGCACGRRHRIACTHPRAGAHVGAEGRLWQPPRPQRTMRVWFSASRRRSTAAQRADLAAWGYAVRPCRCRDREDRRRQPALLRGRDFSERGRRWRTSARSGRADSPNSIRAATLRRLAVKNRR